jgi:hypothetical protein
VDRQVKEAVEKVNADFARKAAALTEKAEAAVAALKGKGADAVESAKDKAEGAVDSLKEKKDGLVEKAADKILDEIPGGDLARMVSPDSKTALKRAAAMAAATGAVPKPQGLFERAKEALVGAAEPAAKALREHTSAHPQSTATVEVVRKIDEEYARTVGSEKAVRWAAYDGRAVQPIEEFRAEKLRQFEARAEQEARERRRRAELEKKKAGWRQYNQKYAGVPY